jgi:MGT family glycosyltransferase
MARALFLGLPLHGHINPSLSLVRALADRGDEVVYYAADRFVADIEQAGGHCRSYGGMSLAHLDLLPTQTDRIAWLLMRMSAGVLEEDLERFRGERPDYIIADSVAPWGQWAAKILRVPLVTSVSTLAFNRKVMAFGVARGVRPGSARLFFSKLRHIGNAWRLHRRLCRRYGVNGPGVMASVMGSSGLNIVYTSRHFQPCADTFDDRFQFVGPMMSRTETIPFPWERVGASDVVYVSLGTLFNVDTAFYRTCFEAFAGQTFQVILSIGTKVSIASLGTVPTNFIVSPQVPQLAVLQRAKAFVTHGGMNSVSEGLFHGVPLVVVPQMGEQAIVGRQVAQLGAGLCVTKEEATAGCLRESVRRLLEEERFRRQADVVRRSFLDAGGPERAADAILAFTR